jgi:hypothetical protein
LITGAGALVAGGDGGSAVGVTLDAGTIAIDDPESTMVWPG